MPLRSVWGDQHLKILLQHWLNEANLDLHYTEKASNPSLCEYRKPKDSHFLAVGRLLGELAVHRHSLSRVWTGYPQALGCILSAITGREAKARAADYSLASLHANQPATLTRCTHRGLGLSLLVLTPHPPVLFRRLGHGLRGREEPLPFSPLQVLADGLPLLRASQMDIGGLASHSFQQPALATGRA